MPTLARYFLPAPAWKPNAKRQPSTWAMSAEEAAARGLTEKDMVPGSQKEFRDLGMQSAGHDGVKG